MTRDSARDADGNLPADHPHAYHRRGSEQIDAAGNFVVVCGRTVNYQKTMNSWSDIDCRACLARRQGLSVVPAPEAESAPGRFAPTGPKSQWCRNCGLFIARHREQAGHAALCPVAKPDPDAAGRAIARAEAESIASRWVPADVRVRLGVSDDITASLVRCRALGRDEGTREASAGCYCKTRQFRVMDAPTGCPQLVPWWLLAPFEPQAKKNHEQTLERLNERGGLDASEMLAVIEGRSFRRMDDAEAGRQLAKLVADAIARRGKEGA